LEKAIAAPPTLFAFSYWIKYHRADPAPMNGQTFSHHKAPKNLAKPGGRMRLEANVVERKQDNDNSLGGTMNNMRLLKSLLVLTILVTAGC